MGVDAVSGATLEHIPNPVSATLVRLKKGEQPTVMKIAPPVAQPMPDETSPQT